MDMQGQILALLHGELEQGKELSVLLEKLASSSEGQQELLEQVAMSRHFSRLGDATIPSSKVDQQVLNAIAQRGSHYSVGQKLAKVPSRFLFGGAIGILLCSFLSFFLGMSVGSKTEANKEFQQPLQASPKTPEETTDSAALGGKHLKSSEEADTVEEALANSHLQTSASSPEVEHRISSAEPQNSWFYFDGEDDVVIIPEVQLSLDSSFTVDMRVYVDNLDQESWFLGYSTQDESGDLLFGMKDGAFRFLTYSLYEVSNDIRVGQDISLGNWHQIVYVQNVDEKVIQVYLDGNLVAETELKQLTPKSRTGTFYIGACNWYNTGRIDRFFQGSLSKIRIWKDALSPARIKSNKYNEDMLVAYWPLSQLSQNMKVVDISKNGYNGVAQGRLVAVESVQN